VQNNLEKLRIVLDSRNTSRNRLSELVSAGDSADGAKIAEEREKLERREASVEEVRELVRHDLAKARTARDEAEDRLQKAQETNTYDFETAEEIRLKAAVARGDILVGHLEHALSAEEATTIRDILASIQEEASRITGPFRLESSRFGDWPGPSVPERLIMLFKEARQPGSKKPILFSGGLMLALAAVILGTVTVAMLTGDRTDANPIGVGEAVVPVLIDSANEAVSIEVTLEYDEDVLTARDVRQGLMSTLGKVAFDVSIPGTASFAVQDKAGIVGSGDLVLIVFKVEQTVSEPTDLIIVSAIATNRDGSEAVIKGENGWLDTDALVNYAPVLHFEEPD